MSDDHPKEERLNDEFRNLGKNLLGVLQAVWEHPERKRMQQEIETGLRELGDVIQREAENFSQSSTGEKIKAEINDIGERIRSEETQSRIYEDLISALKTANSELSKVMSRIDRQEPEQNSPAESDQESSRR